MKSLIMLLILFSFVSNSCVAQKKNQFAILQHDYQDLFKGDSVMLFVGVENKFNTTSDEVLHPEKEIKGIRIKTIPRQLIMTPKYPGIFKATFKTSSGVKKVIFIAKPVSEEL